MMQQQATTITEPATAPRQVGVAAFRPGKPRTGLRAMLFHNRDGIIGAILLLLALSGISGLALITWFIFSAGLPIIWQAGPGHFLFGATWAPESHEFGIFAMILGSLAVTGGAMVIAASFGVGCAIVLTQFCPKWLVSILKPAIELLAGIPSVVYGFIGVVTLAPLISRNLGGTGLSVLAAAIVLGIMVLPTVTSISIDALQAVPRSYRDGSIALGATKWQTTRMVILRSARSGLLAAFILGMGRAIGETMAVIMVAGNVIQIPTSLLQPVRTLTSTIGMEMGYASGDHRQALFATGVVLFVIIMILNTAALTLSGKRARNGGQ
jgi:phosphate ABC transporter permease protein PstC